MLNRNTLPLQLRIQYASGTSTVSDSTVTCRGVPEIALRVLIPFSTGYFLSYYFRTVNAVLSERLTGEFDLTAAQLGLMTAVYFLVAAIVQLPFGWALDRFGPRQLQSVCLEIAALGAVLFALANDFTTLLAARALIGIGVASALLAGMKALAMTAPKEQLGLLNGIFMSIGAAGAIAASAPTEHILQSIDWRFLMIVAATATAASAAIIAIATPRNLVAASFDGPSIGYRQIFSKREFWRLAPLSATGIGSAWALQGLWCAPWLRDVARFDQDAVANQLLLMAVALCIGALSFGVIVHFLSRRGVAPEQTMVGAATIYIIAEISIAFSWPVPPALPWCVVSIFAAGTVLTYTISAQRFPKESVGRANSAFNLLHFGAAFAVQSGIGQAISLWPRGVAGHYPADAYREALLPLVVVQVAALVLFLILGRKRQ